MQDVHDFWSAARESNLPCYWWVEVGEGGGGEVKPKIKSSRSEESVWCLCRVAWLSPTRNDLTALSRFICRMMIKL